MISFKAQSRSYVNQHFYQRKIYLVTTIFSRVSVSLILLWATSFHYSKRLSNFVASLHCQAHKSQTFTTCYRSEEINRLPKPAWSFVRYSKRTFIVSHQSYKDRSHLNYELIHYLYWRDCNSKIIGTNSRKVYARTVKLYCYFLSYTDKLFLSNIYHK